jgi:hypothetical protein
MLHIKKLKTKSKTKREKQIQTRLIFGLLGPYATHKKTKNKKQNQTRKTKPNGVNFRPVTKIKTAILAKTTVKPSSA